MRLIVGFIVLLTCAACTIGGTQPQARLPTPHQRHRWLDRRRAQPGTH